MFSEPRNDRHRCISDRAAADHLRDRDNATEEWDRQYRHESDPMLNSILN